MKQQQSITTLPPSPEAERRSRMIKYTIAMSIRVLCIIGLLFAKGWWLAVFAAGAIFLPYFAVVLANVQGSGRQRPVLRPGGLVRRTPPPTGEPTAEPSDSETPETAETTPEATDDGERGAA
ncbi:DUF3099 domain-containing protein [Agromyces sp. Root81]|uniref:DUF3099 domain-containing protein n=1 Tax=Agromyces sp. Root81 TaxID=1736601 RepID=UPI0009EB0157|nr:DUF3099 domain-containing protein [Agromyces sp. Root81]